MNEENKSTEYKSLRKIAESTGKLKTEGIKDLSITSVAFANGQGGKIIIGIEDGAKEPPVDQKIAPKIANDTISRLKSLCFSVGFELSDIITHDNNGEYFYINIYPSLKAIATTSDGKIYVRIGDKCLPARSEDITRLASEKDAFQWELQPRNITYTDIPQENIEWFADEIRNSDRVKKNIKDLTDIEIIEHYNLLYQGKITNLGVLWLGNKSQ